MFFFSFVWILHVNAYCFGIIRMLLPLKLSVFDLNILRNHYYLFEASVLVSNIAMAMKQNLNCMSETEKFSLIQEKIMFSHAKF